MGLVGSAGDWIGFAPSRVEGYDLVVGRGDVAASRADAEPDDLLALAVAYFEEALAEPPEDLAATHGDIGGLVRYVAGGATDEAHSADLLEAVDAIDDGLAADVVVSRLVRCLSDPEEPVARLHRRAAELGASVRR